MKYKCRCGGEMIIDEAKKRTMHSIPACAEYMAIINEGIATGKVKSEGIKVTRTKKGR